MILRKNQKNPNVRAWKLFLLSQGFSGMSDNDQFGEGTETATKAFQASVGIREDGIVGDVTIANGKEKGFAGFPPETANEEAAATAPSTGKMSVSRRGLDFIKSFEKEVLKVYDDGYGFPTVGIGHLVKPEDGLKLGDRITPEQSAAFFAKDVAEHAKPVDDLVKVLLTQGQYDALVSLVFNIGGGNFKKSSVLRALNAGDHTQAKARFMAWIRAAGAVSRGLIRRRREEQKIFDA